MSMHFLTLCEIFEKALENGLILSEKCGNIDIVKKLTAPQA